MEISDSKNTLLLKEKYPVPLTNNIKSYRFALDGGGRDLIQEHLIEKDVKIMIEIGCFLCGSVIQWLEYKSDLIVIGIDPWQGSWHDILRRYIKNSVFDSCFRYIDNKEDFIKSVEKHGPYLSSMANVQKYKDRFIPIIGESPQKLYELKKIKPDLIYFDSNKTMTDIDVAFKLFPDTILSGDDWTWKKDDVYPVRNAVERFSENNGFNIKVKKATWLLTPTSSLKCNAVPF